MALEYKLIFQLKDVMNIFIAIEAAVTPVGTKGFWFESSPCCPSLFVGGKTPKHEGCDEHHRSEERGACCLSIWILFVT